MTNRGARRSTRPNRRLRYASGIAFPVGSVPAPNHENLFNSGRSVCLEARRGAGDAGIWERISNLLAHHTPCCGSFLQPDFVLLAHRRLSRGTWQSWTKGPGVRLYWREFGVALGYCVFHAKVDTDSTPRWTVIPRQAGHLFQGKLDT